MFPLLSRMVQLPLLPLQERFLETAGPRGTDSPRAEHASPVDWFEPAQEAAGITHYLYLVEMPTPDTPAPPRRWPPS